MTGRVTQHLSPRFRRDSACGPNRARVSGAERIALDSHSRWNVVPEDPTTSRQADVLSRGARETAGPLIGSLLSTGPRLATLRL